MLFEVTTYSNGNCVIKANSNRAAKINVCKSIGVKPFDSWCGISSMHARKVDVEFLEILYRPDYDEKLFRKYEGKDIVIYDEHHGIAVRIRKATAAAIGYYWDEYSTIIILQNKCPSS